jgi:type I restriction enzyme M protein
LLFLHLILRVLDMGGRCAVIVPDGVLFGSSKAHVETRKRIIEENRLDGVVSMPSGVFKPYAGVSTAALLFTRGATTDRVWFYDMEHDGFSLDDKRTPTPDANDIPDVLKCWENRFDKKFNAAREKRLQELRELVEPLKQERLRLEKEINRAQFENAIANGDGDAASVLSKNLSGLQDLTGLIAPLQKEINQLTRQFWVTKEQVRGNKYDLSASRYRQIEQDEEFYEEPQVTLERLLKLESVMSDEAKELEKAIQ